MMDYSLSGTVYLGLAVLSGAAFPQGDAVSQHNLGLGARPKGFLLYDGQVIRNAYG